MKEYGIMESFIADSNGKKKTDVGGGRETGF